MSIDVWDTITTTNDSGMVNFYTSSSFPATSGGGSSGQRLTGFSYLTWIPWTCKLSNRQESFSTFNSHIQNLGAAFKLE